MDEMMGCPERQGQFRF